MAHPIRWREHPRIVLAAAAMLVFAATWLWSTHRPEAQARETFARLRAAIEAGDAGGVIDELHPDYDVAALWPAYFHAPRSPDAESPRSLAQRALTFYFFQRGGVRLVADIALRRIEPQQDGTVVVEASLAVGPPQRPVVAADPPHRFVLARDVWWSGRLRIRSHDAIAVSP